MEKGANRAPVQSTSNNAGEIRDVSATENVFTQEEIVKKPLAISSGQADAFVDTLNLPLDPIVERSFRRKCDLYIVPLLTLSFIFAFIDRYDEDQTEKARFGCSLLNLMTGPIWGMPKWSA